MPLITPRLVFLHLPKTGGTWIRAALPRAGIQCRNVGQYNGHVIPRARAKRGRLVFTFVRETVSWYGSYWAFKTKRDGWGVRSDPGPRQHINTFDADCRAETFEEFICNVLELWPGHYTREYIEPFTAAADVVGRYEHLADDLVQILQRADEPFDEERLRLTHPQRVTGRGIRFAGRLWLPDNLRDRLVESEPGAASRPPGGQPDGYESR